ncbi:MAG TPA: hypothetical protein VFB58_17170 [Chloroflexota bacterium]|nr:hypothetical protein [Chloroflexota bacterium]
MYRILSPLAFLAAIVFCTMPSHAATPPWRPVNASGPHGIVPSHASPFARSGSGNLVYHSGGSVQTGTKTTYAIYWNPWGATDDASYQSTINTYFSNVAAASGAASNVYDVDTQYYQNIGSTAYITYAETSAGSGTDTTTPSSSGCSSTAGGTLGCVSDAQMQQEVLNYVHANNLPEGLGHEYFVFLGNGVSTCSGSSCFVSQFCAYHGSFTDSSTGQTVLYANMPYAGYSLSACGSGQYPNGDSAADSTINVTSHEANETITDPLGNAWYDRTGYEIGDKCAWNFGTALGGVSGKEYNQVINGHDYYLQQEWSNKNSGCVLHM